MNNLKFIEDYKKFIKFEKRLSSASVKSYLRDINDLLELMGNKNLENYSVEDIRKNISVLHSKGLNGKSLSRMISSWRGFFNFLIHKHKFKKNPTLGIKAPKSCLLYTSPSPRDATLSRMPSSA